MLFTRGNNEGHVNENTFTRLIKWRSLIPNFT